MDYYKSGDKYDHDNEYHPVSYEEAQRMREQVRNGAVNNQVDFVKQQYAAGNNTPRRNNSGGYSDINNDPPEEMPYEIRAFREMNGRRRSSARDGFGIVIVLLLFGLFVISDTCKDISHINRKAKESEQLIAEYKEISGTLSKVRKSRARDYSRLGKSTYYDVWEVYYTYQYNGKSYEDIQTFRSRDANYYGFKDTNVSGQTTSVYIDPENPKQSLIRTHLRAGTYYAPFIIFGLIVIAASGVVYVLFDKGYFTVISGGRQKQIRFGRY